MLTRVGDTDQVLTELAELQRRQRDVELVDLPPIGFSRRMTDLQTKQDPARQRMLHPSE